MKTLLIASAILLSLCACDGANDNPTNARPPGAIGTDPGVTAAPPAGGAQCTQEAKICKDGSVAMVTPGTCEQSCPGE